LPNQNLHPNNTPSSSQMEKQAPKSVVDRFPVQPESKPKAGKNFLLIIAIDNYVHCKPLNNAVKDAKKIAELLTTKFQFDPAHTTYLYDESATEENIHKKFEELAETISPNDNFVLYFSGHGEEHEKLKKGTWIPYNAEPSAHYDHISNKDIHAHLSAINSLHTFVIVDSCFSGSLFMDNYKKTDRLRNEFEPSRWGLTAGRNEIVSDGLPGMHSPFAQSIINQLTETTEAISVSDLCEIVKEEVAAHENQQPRGEPLRVEGHKGGKFILHLKKTEEAEWQEALEKCTLKKFKKFIKEFPEGVHFKKAKKHIKELKEWKKAYKAYNEDGFKYYLSNYKNPLKKEIAEDCLGELWVWQNALDTPTAESYAKYLVGYKGGRFEKEALQKIDAINNLKVKIDAPVIDNIVIAPKDAPTPTNSFKQLYALEEAQSPVDLKINQTVQIQLFNSCMNHLKTCEDLSNQPDYQDHILAGIKEVIAFFKLPFTLSPAISDFQFISN